METAGWQRVLAHWHQTFGGQPVRVRELGSALDQARDLDLPPSIASALGYAPDAGTRHTRLAKKIQAVEGRRFDDNGLRILRAGTDSHTKSILWQIIRDHHPTLKDPA